MNDGSASLDEDDGKKKKKKKSHGFYAERQGGI